MIFVRFRAIGKMESASVCFITGLLQQIGTPKRGSPAPIEPPGTENACRQIICASRHNYEYRFSCGQGNQFDIAVEEIFLDEMVDPRGQSITSTGIGINSNCRRSAEAEIDNHRVYSGAAAKPQEVIILAYRR